MSKNEFTNEWYIAYMAKRRLEKNPMYGVDNEGQVVLIGPEDIPELSTPGPEKALQQKVQDYCKENGWPCFHDRSKKVNTPGWPDCFIFLPGMGEATAYKIAAHCLTPIEHEIEPHKGQQIADKIVAQLRGKGKVVLIELKSESGTFRKEQKELRLILYRLGHKVYSARSFKRVVEIIEWEREDKGGYDNG